MLRDYLKRELLLKSSKQMNLKENTIMKNFGGALSLGINGIVLKCHGSSSEFIN